MNAIKKSTTKNNTKSKAKKKTSRMTKKPAKSSPKKVPLRARRMGREIWITTAKDALTTGGIEAVKVERLAKTLNAERGSFYHHFKNRDELLDELLQHWASSNTHAYEEAIENNEHNGVAELDFINTMWLEEKTFDAKYDLAIRDWARTSDKVAKVVRRSDKKRIQVLETIFLNLGYEGENALVRAQVAYFHQIGYLTLGLGESAKTRRARAPIFLEVLLGK